MNHMPVPYAGGAYFNRQDLWEADIAKLQAADPATFRRGTFYTRNEETLLTATLRLLFGHPVPPFYACGKGHLLLGEVALSTVAGDHFQHLKRTRNFPGVYCSAFISCFDSPQRGNLQQRAVNLIKATAPGTNLTEAGRRYNIRKKNKADISLFIACLEECRSSHPPVMAAGAGAFALAG